MWLIKKDTSINLTRVDYIRVFGKEIKFFFEDNVVTLKFKTEKEAKEFKEDIDMHLKEFNLLGV